MARKDNNKSIIEPDRNTINKAIENINSNNINGLKTVVEKMILNCPNGSTTWLFCAVYENLVGNLNNAEKAIIKTFKINPEYGEAHRVYSDIYKKKGEFLKSLHHAKIATKINNRSAAAFDTLGTAYASVNDHTNAEKNFRHALNLNPDLAVSLNNLGNALRNLGNHNESVKAFKNALEKSSSIVEIYTNLALTYFELKDYHNALETLKIGESKITNNNSPNLPDIFTTYGHIFNKTNQFSKAKRYYEKALALNKNFSSAHNGMGEVLSSLRRPKDAYNSFRKSLPDAPNKSISFSNIILCGTYLCDFTHEEKYELALKYNDIEKVEKINLNRNYYKNRKLRVGFVSGDFFEHPVSYFLINPLKYFSDENFESVAFNNSKLNDSMTLKLKEVFNEWINIFHLSDDALANTILDQKIDILIDLSGHTANNRLRVFRYKPAPIQITWLGYSATTGIKEIDYIICDEISLPQEDEKWYVEKPLRMKNSYYCFERFTNKDIEIENQKKNDIYFGCFNNAKKLNNEVLDTWSDILNSLPNSKLMLKSKHYSDKALQEDIQKYFSDNNVNPIRINFLEYSLREEYLKSYNSIDICLDPFPYPGGTTTCEALYMGKPVITMKGKTFLSRNGQNILINSNLEYLVANNHEEYIKKAIELSKNIKSFNNNIIRKKFLNSSLVDGLEFSNNLKENLNNIWTKHINQDVNYG